jgi:hypothetical protein
MTVLFKENGWFEAKSFSQLRRAMTALEGCGDEASWRYRQRPALYTINSIQA